MYVKEGDVRLRGSGLGEVGARADLENRSIRLEPGLVENDGGPYRRAGLSGSHSQK